MMRTQERRDGERLFIGAYRAASTTQAAIAPIARVERFYTFVGEGQHIARNLRDPAERSVLELIRMQLVPQAWQADMHKLIARFAQVRGLENSLAQLGAIRIAVSTRGPHVLAETSNYYPKSSFYDDKLFPSMEMIRAAPGLGYSTEFMVFSSMRDRVTHIRTSNAISANRADQLARVGLPVKRMTPISQWLNGMLEGFRQSIERHQARQQGTVA